MSIRQHDGACVWLTGLPCSGKTTIAKMVEKKLAERLVPVERLDGDVLRSEGGVCSDLGFSKEDRDENIRRVTLLSQYLVKKNIVLCCFVSPYTEARSNARKAIGNFYEVFVDTPAAECEKRDVKGMYQLARESKIKGFTGVDAPYEPPTSPEIHLTTVDSTPEECADRIIAMLESGGHL